MAGNNITFSYPNLICSYIEPNSDCSLPNEDEMNIIRQICTAARTQNYILFTIALMLGIPGSILAFITFSRMPINPSTIYLRLLSVSDLISLCFLSVTYYKILDLRYPTPSEDLTKWIARLFQAVSHWLLVYIVFERFITIRFPLRKAALYTMRTVIWTIIAAFLLSSVPLILYCLEKSGIITHPKIRFYYIIGYLFIYIFVPTTLIILFTSLTAIELKKSQERRRNLTSSAGSSKMEADLTRMMFLSAVSFVVLTSPFCIFHVFDRIDDFFLELRFCVVMAAVEYIILFTCASLSYVNHAINFYVYMIGAPGFRKQFLQILPFMKKTESNKTNKEKSLS